jgi:hypothetical protein
MNFSKTNSTRNLKYLIPRFIALLICYPIIHPFQNVINSRWNWVSILQDFSFCKQTLKYWVNPQENRPRVTDLCMSFDLALRIRIILYYCWNYCLLKINRKAVHFPRHCHNQAAFIFLRARLDYSASPGFFAVCIATSDSSQTLYIQLENKKNKIKYIYKLATELCLTSLLTIHYNIRRSLCDFNYDDPTDEQ